jgi:serine/alanine adding enzyme
MLTLTAPHADARLDAGSSVTSAPRLSVQVAQESDAADWDTFVAAHPDATGYHRWGWRPVFERGLGYRCVYFIARESSRVVGVLPAVIMRSALFGKALSSLPYVNYGGVLALSGDAASQLLDAAAKEAAGERLSYVLLRHRARQFPSIPARDHKVTMLLRLPETSDALWQQIDRKVRNQIRKAEKSELTVESGSLELLDEFYTIFARNMRDLGTPAYGRALFAEMLTAFPEDARIHVVRLKGVAIAASLAYRYGNVVEVPSASSLREHRSLCPNHLLYWNMLKDAVTAGVSVFDFGRSTPNDGTYQFKQQWGAEPVQLWWEYRLIGDAALPTNDRKDAKFQWSIELWKKLPLAVANVVGPRIARAVP